MVDQLKALHDAGRFDECYALIQKGIADSNTPPVEQRNLAVFIVERSIYFLFDEVIRLLDSYLASGPMDVVAYQAHAYASWVKGHNERAMRSCERAIILKQDEVFCYRVLAMMHLCEQRYFQAFSILGAGLLFASDKQPLMPWMILATNMLKGVQSVKVGFDGLQFHFGLTCFNAMAMESTVNHLTGRMNEPDELKMIREEIGSCRSIVECGSLVGNHTLFFAKALKPQRILVLDADERSLAQTKVNFGLNPDVKDIALDLRHRAIGSGGGEMTFFGKQVKITSIDEEAPDDVDFLKIDVDGMEMAALNGMRGLIARCRPKIMIEVSNEYLHDFNVFLGEVGYEVKRRLVRGGDGNYLIAPIAKIS